MPRHREYKLEILSLILTDFRSVTEIRQQMQKIFGIYPHPSSILNTLRVLKIDDYVQFEKRDMLITGNRSLATSFYKITNNGKKWLKSTINDELVRINIELNQLDAKKQHITLVQQQIK